MRTLQAIWRTHWIVLLALCSATRAAAAEDTASPPSIPTAEAVAKMLADEPLSRESWPKWRPRLRRWLGDESQATQAAYHAACQFMLEQADDQGQLDGALAEDPLAWYFLGGGQLRAARGPGDVAQAAQAAEASYRKSIELDPRFARAHRNLAFVLLLQPSADTPENRAAVARHLEQASELDADMPLKWVEARAALANNDFERAEPLLREALAEEPTDVTLAESLAIAILSNAREGRSVTAELASLAARFPESGELACYHGVALARDGEFGAAAGELDRAEQAGVDPAKVLSPQLTEEIRKRAAPSPFRRAGRWALVFLGFYAVVMLLMVLTAWMLAGFTRGTKALELLGSEPGELIQVDQVKRTASESLLARMYAIILTIGLVLFYAAIPFVALGLLAGTAGLLYLILLSGHIPVKLFLVILVVGLLMVWSILKSVFAKPAEAGFGIPLTPAEEPQIHALLSEVAERLNTDPVDEVYLSPGAEIGVHQTGRGPFGIFGTRKRVLTLGMSSMQYLTADELRAILAHEYAHFTHGDTFYTRFVHQVTMSIESALQGMAEAGGKLNYVNPFFWFMVLYYRAYSMMAAGFSRSREFLADRLAAGLYGANVFKRGLMKVATEANFVATNVYSNLMQLVATGQTFENMYEAFRQYEEQAEDEDEDNRDKLYREILEQKSSLFASHPAIPERLAAVQGLPDAPHEDDASARDLLADPQNSEQELTAFATAYFQYLQQLQAQEQES